MNAPIELIEYQTRRCTLAEVDALFIISCLGKQISIQRTLDGADYDLNPNQYVGLVSLPSGRSLICSPKVPIQNLFLMLAVAYELDQRFRDEVATLERLDDLLEFIVAHFADLVDARLRRGPYRDYVEIEENLGVVRGRILAGRDLQYNLVLRHRTYCQYSVFTQDIPENQIVRQVIHHLNNWVRGPKLRLRLRYLDDMLGEVQPTNLSVAELDHIRYHRQNDDYGPIHKLCRLFLEGASLRESEGPIDSRTFLIDMNRLFEVFVAQVLRENAPRDLELRAQALRYLDLGQRIHAFPDLLISERGIPVLVADTKYKRPFKGESMNADLYQMLAYCVVTSVQRGLLVYPMSELVEFNEYAVRNTQIEIHQIGIDLDVSMKQFGEACRRFADQFYTSARNDLVHSH